MDDSDTKEYNTSNFGLFDKYETIKMIENNLLYFDYVNDKDETLLIASIKSIPGSPFFHA